MMAASKQNIVTAVGLFILLFLIGYWTSPYFFDWFLLGAINYRMCKNYLRSKPGTGHTSVYLRNLFF
jgi:hypothetical protein